MRDKTCSRCNKSFHRHNGFICFECMNESKAKKLAYKSPMELDPIKASWFSLSKRDERQITLGDYRKLFLSKKCAYCGFDLEHELARPEIDHIIPKSKGGKSISANLVRTCRMCNRAKGTMSLHEFMVWLNYVRSTR